MPACTNKDCPYHGKPCCTPRRTAFQAQAAESVYGGLYSVSSYSIPFSGAGASYRITLPLQMEHSGISQHTGNLITILVEGVYEIHYLLRISVEGMLRFAVRRNGQPLEETEEYRYTGGEYTGILIKTLKPGDTLDLAVIPERVTAAEFPTGRIAMLFIKKIA